MKLIRAVRIALALSLGLTLAIVWLLFCPRLTPSKAQTNELHVCHSGCLYTSIQAAVDSASEGDIIKVATGIYTDVNVRPRNDITTTGVVAQVMYLSKTVTIQGGYTTTNWTTPYPITQPTTLDAQGQGRVIYITGNISPTVAGFDIIGGKAEGLGGHSNSSGTTGDVGGGVYIITASARLSHNRVFSNAAEFGNGLYLRTPTSILSNNKIFENWTGPGFFYTRLGGGLFLYQAGVTLQGNDIISNTAVYDGGGLFIESSHVTFMGNHIAGNETYASGYGGGVLVFESIASFDGDIIASNSSADECGGLALIYSHLVMTNTVIRDNHANNGGSGLCVLGYDASISHSTIAHNTGGTGSGVYVGGNVTMTNVIVVSQTVGITATSGSTAMLDGVLWFGNGANTGRVGTITVTHEITGDPAFAPDGYHLTSGSAAIDHGVDAGVPTDIDGDPRPRGLAPDLGADEYWPLTRFVSTTGADAGDCSNSAAPCRTVQYAVDMADEGNTIKVATGVYTSVNVRPRNDITTTGVVTQVVYVSKTMTIQGGYTTTNWTTPYPITQPTTLDAQGQGRVIYITGNISPTIEGLHITGGDASGLGGSEWTESAGNGIYVIGSRITLKRNVIFSNTSSAYIYGAGLYLQSSMVELYKNEILSNTGFGGGGIVVYSSTAMLTENWIHNNLTCGAVIASSVATLTNNVIDNNYAGYGGGGALVRESKAALIGNTISQNTAGWNSGGVAVVRSEASLERNLVTHNSANHGGGIGIFDSNATLANNTIAENAGTAGSGLYFQASQTQLLHNTLVHNTGGSGIDANQTMSNVASFTNTIIVSHTVGLVVDWRHTTVLNGILWFGNGANTGGTGTIAVTHEITGDPAFAPDGYHLTEASAAIDQGVDAGVTTDIDGDPRPRGLAPDLGADEFFASTLALSAGWNLVALPLQPLTPYQAQSLLDSINSQVNNCSELDRWLNGGWDAHINGLSFNNFDVMLGQGYFIRCTSAGNWSLPGYTLSAGVAISLQPGWNLVALPHPPSEYTAQSWLEGITSQGGACSEIDRWQNGGWNSFINGLPFNNFDIEPNRGYFIRCSRPSSFTPQ